MEHECRQETVISILRENGTNIYNELQATSEKLDNIGLSLVRNTISLEEHMKQTVLLQDQQLKFHQDLLDLQQFKIKFTTIGSAIVKAAIAVGSTITIIYTILSYHK